MLKWIILGGGIHGSTIASHLIKKKKVTPDQIRIIDPNAEPLAEWKKRTGFIDMPYLRSPGVHHLDTDPFSLKAYGKKYGTETDFYGAYSRPSLYLFNEHSDRLFSETTLMDCWYQGMAEKVTRKNQAWLITLKDQTVFESENLVIATGPNRKLHLPDWGHKAKEKAPSQVSHVFEAVPPSEGPFVVIGGGISAAHLVTRLSKEFPGQVTQLTRHPYRVHAFDSDPGWLGPKYMEGFKKLNDYRVRRDTITQARHRGSIPSDLQNRLHWLQKEQSYQLLLDETESFTYKNGTFTLHQKSGNLLEVKTIYFATGFSHELMDTPWLNALIRDEKLKCAHCGFPVVKENLSWCDHLYVSGPLAELELGPSSRNIIGAMKAAERITAI
ncbi:FAD/NAD(P)-binding protein [Jeotgalibacillus sp. R-1-5s-1]|uniref:FAD/NAD(P)-binding protein n=1 Tax=Jeotgalibacillus sp. R-1-5s-1 TaxID=2555897 RepID=UPI00141A935A|nr:FAD/NAD(P)-binding protein [Jeotgalibacillus sp. R-1-5s-1]